LHAKIAFRYIAHETTSKIIVQLNYFAPPKICIYRYALLCNYCTWNHSFTDYL